MTFSPKRPSPPAPDPNWEVELHGDSGAPEGPVSGSKDELLAHALMRSEPAPADPTDASEPLDELSDVDRVTVPPPVDMKDHVARMMAEAALIDALDNAEFDNEGDRPTPLFDLDSLPFSVTGKAPAAAPPASPPRPVKPEPTPAGKPAGVPLARITMRSRLGRDVSGQRAPAAKEAPVRTKEYDSNTIAATAPEARKSPPAAPRPAGKLPAPRAPTPAPFGAPLKPQRSPTPFPAKAKVPFKSASAKASPPSPKPGGLPDLDLDDLWPTDLPGESDSLGADDLPSLPTPPPKPSSGELGPVRLSEPAISVPFASQRSAELVANPNLDDPPEETIAAIEARVSAGDFGRALVLAESALIDHPASSTVLGFADRCRGELYQRYMERLGAHDHVPRLAVSRRELTDLALDHRAGFLLSCVDGMSTVEELIDVSAMPRLEAVRVLYDLLQQGIIEMISQR